MFYRTGLHLISLIFLWMWRCLSGFSYFVHSREGFADVFSYLESKDKDELLEALSVEETRYLLADLSPMTEPNYSRISLAR